MGRGGNNNLLYGPVDEQLIGHPKEGFIKASSFTDYSSLLAENIDYFIDHDQSLEEFEEIVFDYGQNKVFNGWTPFEGKLHQDGGYLTQFSGTSNWMIKHPELPKWMKSKGALICAPNKTDYSTGLEEELDDINDYNHSSNQNFELLSNKKLKFSSAQINLPNHQLICQLTATSDTKPDVKTYFNVLDLLIAEKAVANNSGEWFYSYISDDQLENHKLVYLIDQRIHAVSELGNYQSLKEYIDIRAGQQEFVEYSCFY